MFTLTTSVQELRKRFAEQEGGDHFHALLFLLVNILGMMKYQISHSSQLMLVFTGNELKIICHS